jgi:HEAT repeat protein
MGRMAESAVPALIEKLKDKEREVRNAAAVSLEEIGNTPATEALASYSWE